eukprot:SM000190S04858  [mRNA]  locus=s190:71072:71490:- [translate_table: standard]
MALPASPTRLWCKPRWTAKRPAVWGAAAFGSLPVPAGQNKKLLPPPHLRVVGVHNLLRDALAGLMRDAGYRAIVEVSNVMPITTDSQGGHHRRTLDIVGVQPGGGPRALVDVVVTEAYKSSASTHIAGHAVG